MKVAYVFSSSGHTASYKLGCGILPRLEDGDHGAEVVGMFFFGDNTYLLRQGDPMGERLSKVAKEKNVMLMLCDQCALERGLAEGEARSARPVGTVEGCFPDLYGALAGNPPESSDNPVRPLPSVAPTKSGESLSGGGRSVEGDEVKNPPTPGERSESSPAKPIPAEARKHGRILLDQLMWCFGKDIPSAAGNALIAHGFSK